LGLIYSFRGSVYYHHGREHGVRSGWHGVTEVTESYILIWGGGGKRERERERDRDRDRDRETETERQRQRQRDRDRETERVSFTETGCR
jgi:hypothetical protein